MLGIEEGFLWLGSYVLLAAIVEVFWVIGLKYSSSVIEWIGTGIVIVLSFYFIIKACEKLCQQVPSMLFLRDQERPRLL